MIGDPSPWPRRPRPSANPALLTAPPALSLPLSCLPLTSPSYSAPLTKGSGTHGGPRVISRSPASSTPRASLVSMSDRTALFSAGCGPCPGKACGWERPADTEPEAMACGGGWEASC